MKLYIKFWTPAYGLSIYNNPASSENYEERVQLTFDELSLKKPLYFPENKSESYIHIKRRMKLK
jgi:hypothetical protein